MAFDHDLKFRRAFDHLMDLDKRVKPWVKGERHATRCEVDPKNGTRTYFATAEQPEKNTLSPIIGDVLHNLRSGLDNLAFALACAFTNPLPDPLATASEFPIFGDRGKNGATGVGHDKFHQLKRDGTAAPNSGLSKIEGWCPDAQTAVELLQPYKRGNSFEEDPLWILHELDRIDKHRLMHVAVVGIESGSLGFSPKDRNLAGFGMGVIQFLGGPIETDTPYCRMTGIELLPVDPKKEVYMDVPLTVRVAFAPGTPCVEDQPVYKVLLGIYAHIKTVVAPCLERYL